MQTRFSQAHILQAHVLRARVSHTHISQAGISRARTGHCTSKQECTKHTGMPFPLTIACRSARDFAAEITGLCWGSTRLAYAVEEPVAITAASRQAKGDDVVERFFGNVVPPAAVIHLWELESVDRL
eukprot:2227586-Pleurochrysis_carterae.AAC.1